MTCPVCDVGVLWPNSWMDQDETWQVGMQVGLSHGHTELHGDKAPPAQKGHNPQIFGPYLLWPNGWMDQDVTW